MGRSDYTHMVIQYDGRDTLVITDTDLGRMSVTNDMENVLAEMDDLYDGLPEVIVYRDSQGDWDGVSFAGGRESVQFYGLGTTDMDVAIYKAHKIVFSKDSAS